MSSGDGAAATRQRRSLVGNWRYALSTTNMPPGATDPGSLNVLVGSASAGQAYFSSKCAGCHSVTGDLKGIASRYADPRTLQNT